MEELWLPAHAETARSLPSFPPDGAPPPDGLGVVVNETDLPNAVVETYIAEHAELLGLSHRNAFTSYVGSGSLMTRPKYRVPTSYLEEVILARDFAESDDDVGATIGAMQALAFGEGMQHSHPDEVTVALFDEVADESSILPKFKEMYREWLVSGQVVTATIFVRKALSFVPMGENRQRTRSVLCPLIAILPSEQIRVIGNDIFGSAELAYRPFSGRQERWLAEYFDAGTSAARKNEMRQQDPIITTLLTERLAWQNAAINSAEWAYGDPYDPVTGMYVYRLNPQLVQRITMPKGQWPNPKAPLAKIFPLLEAKRLLTIMDYALLESGANFLVVAKKGTDERPAQPAELRNLHSTIARASRSGVIIGDHRLSIEIITPKLDELLNPAKRKLLGRKVAQALMRVPDITDADAGSTNAANQDTELLSRVVTSDRDDLRRHMEQAVYKLCSQRNNNLAGSPGIWFPKIVLQGLNFFNDMIITLRDRGDIPRKYAVEAAGFDWTASVQQRKLEVSSGDDKVMQPAQVPFDSPNKGPQDQGGGRPAGTPTGGGRVTPPGGGSRVVTSNAGETVRAMWEGDTLRRVGEVTMAMLETYPDAQIGRISRRERAALNAGSEHGVPYEAKGGLFVVPVNVDTELSNLQVVRLADGMAAVIGQRADDAMLTLALLFRQPINVLDATETAMKLGFPPSMAEEEDE